jgi:hypothetical protein
MLVVPTLTKGQETFTQYLYWLRYQNQLIFSPKLYWNNDIDNRRFFNPDVENQLILHSRLHYKKGPWDFGGGITFSWAYAARPENGFNHAVSEIRPVIEANHEVLIKNIGIQNRVRIDNRFFEVDEESVLDTTYYVMRFRYRLQGRIPLKRNDHDVPTITLRVADEIMFNSKENTFDQNRIYATGEFYLNKNFSLELGYIYIYQQRFGTDDFFKRNVLRFSVLHKVFR